MKTKKDVTIKEINGYSIVKLRGGRPESIHRDRKKYTRKRKHKNSEYD